MSQQGSSQRPSIFRSKLLIFPQFQLALVAANLVIMLGVAAITWIQMRRAFADLDAMAGMSAVEAQFYHRFIEHHASGFQGTLVLTLILAVVVSTVFTFAISHRFSGPLVRVRRYFEEIGAGKFPLGRLKFRQGDFLGDLPPVINRAMDVLEQRLSDKR